MIRGGRRVRCLLRIITNEIKVLDLELSLLEG
jgi:hypothetical protein